MLKKFAQKKLIDKRILQKNKFCRKVPPPPIFLPKPNFNQNKNLPIKIVPIKKNPQKKLSPKQNFTTNFVNKKKIAKKKILWKNNYLHNKQFLPKNNFFCKKKLTPKIKSLPKKRFCWQKIFWPKTQLPFFYITRYLHHNLS